MIAFCIIYSKQPRARASNGATRRSLKHYQTTLRLHMRKEFTVAVAGLDPKRHTISEIILESAF